MAGIRRRGVLAGAAALAVAGLAPRRLGAQTLPGGVASAMPALREVFGERRFQTGRVFLKVPAVAENATSVQVSTGMSGERPARIVLLAPANPFPMIAELRFGPRAAAAEAAIRIRLARTQTLVAAAELADKSVWIAAADVTVTSGACIEADE
jgi:sulfur-oxidizing protein SoxY